MSVGSATYSIGIKISVDTGKGKLEAKKLDVGLGNLTKTVSNIGRGFERFGRTISITGFVMGIVARRIIGSFEGIAKSIIKISEEGANLDRALDYLGKTLEALALSGMLTDDTLDRIIGTFREMMDIALRSAGPWAIITDAIQQLKDAVALGALPSLEDLSNFLLGFNLGPFKEALSEATNTFLTPIIEKIKELLGDENGGVIGIKEKLNAIATIGGNFLAGVLGGFDQMMTKAAELIGDDASGMAGISSKFGELAAWALVLAPAGAITGMIVGGFGSILGAISAVVGIMGGVATGGLLLGIAAIATHWGEWSTVIIPGLLTQLDELAAALGIEGGGLQFVLGGVKIALDVVNGVFVGMASGITAVLSLITALINKLNALREAWSISNIGGGFGGGGGSMESRQGGGFINKTGEYLLHAGEMVVPRNQVNSTWTPTFYITGGDPVAIADEVEKRLAQRSRSPYITR